MSDFKEIAEKTVVELFDMVKEKVSEIERKQAEIDLLKRLIEIKDRVRDEQQAKIDDLEKQLDMMKYINDEQSKNIQNAFKTIEIEQGFKDELQKRVDGALFEMQQLSLMLSKDIDGYEDPAQICQSEGVDMGVRILEKALRGEHESN